MQSHNPPKRWPIPAVVSIVIRNKKVLLVQRKNDPDAGLWGFPGGKIELGESIEEAAERELLEETSIQGQGKKIFHSYSFVHRKNGEIIHHFIILVVLCQWLKGEAKAGDDALKAQWFKVEELKNLDLKLVKNIYPLAKTAMSLMDADES